MEAIDHHFCTFLPFSISCIFPMIEIRSGNCDNAQGPECYRPNRTVGNFPALFGSHIPYVMIWEVERLWQVNGFNVRHRRILSLFGSHIPYVMIWEVERLWRVNGFNVRHRRILSLFGSHIPYVMIGRSRDFGK